MKYDFFQEKSYSGTGVKEAAAAFKAYESSVISDNPIVISDVGYMTRYRGENFVFDDEFKSKGNYLTCGVKVELRNNSLPGLKAAIIDGGYSNTGYVDMTDGYTYALSAAALKTLYKNLGCINVNKRKSQSQIDDDDETLRQIRDLALFKRLALPDLDSDPEHGFTMYVPYIKSENGARKAIGFFNYKPTVYSFFDFIRSCKSVMGRFVIRYWAISPQRRCVLVEPTNPVTIGNFVSGILFTTSDSGHIGTNVQAVWRDKRQEAFRYVLHHTAKINTDGDLVKATKAAIRECVREQKKLAKNVLSRRSASTMYFVNNAKSFIDAAYAVCGIDLKPYTGLVKKYCTSELEIKMYDIIEVMELVAGLMNCKNEDIQFLPDHPLRTVCGKALVKVKMPAA